ncbi:hypothetical protein DF160_11300 [Burkholderia anthina]|nr:hypothetical protein DF160_11300 [Burkholderia anthina]
MKRGRPTSHANDALRVRDREWRRSFAAAWSHAAESGRARGAVDRVVPTGGCDLAASRRNPARPRGVHP